MMVNTIICEYFQNCQFNPPSKFDFKSCDLKHDKMVTKRLTPVLGGIWFLLRTSGSSFQKQIKSKEPLAQEF